MTDPSIRQQQQRERRERLARVEERLRQENLKTESAQADRQRALDMNLNYQASTYYEKALRLLMLDKLINGD